MNLKFNQNIAKILVKKSIYIRCWFERLVFLLWLNSFPADNFSKNSTKVIPNKECMHITNTQYIKTVYFESNLIHLQQYFSRYDVIRL